MISTFSVSDILSWTQGRIANARELGDDGKDIRVGLLSPLGTSGPGNLAFFFSKNYESELPTAKPGILVVGEPFAQALEKSGLPLWKKSAVIACADPYGAMAILSEKFAAHLSTVAHFGRTSGADRTPTQVHPSAVVHKTAELGPGVAIGPGCVVEEGVRIGARSVLYLGCYVGPRAVLGEACVLFPHVTLYEWTELGNRVRIHAGSVLGSDGFGYAPMRGKGGQVEKHLKIYHLGRVVVGDDVEIGANSCVDRSTLGVTQIEKGAKLDNLVHVGHNSRVDEGAIICGGTCLAGRASVGKFAYVGGLTGITNDVHVGDGASVGALSLVTKDVPAGGTAVGNPQREYREHFKAHAKLSRLVTERKEKSRE